MFNFGVSEVGRGLEYRADIVRTEIRMFHNQLFPGMRASTNWFRWYSTIDSYTVDEPTRFYTARKDNEIVGLWCVEPKVLRVNEFANSVGRCFAVGIHADHRRQGLFVDLSSYAIEEERKRGSYKHILGFPQIGKPVVDAHLKVGWNRVQRINTHVFPITALSTEFNESATLYSTCRINDFSIVRHALVGKNGIEESASYKNERWLCHPENTYTCLRCGDSSFIVLKQHGTKMHVLDITARDFLSSTTEHLLLCARNLAYKHGCASLSLWCAENDPLTTTLDNVNKQLDERHRSVVDDKLSIDMLAVSVSAKESLQLERSGFNTGLEEGY